ncbi:3-hydroxyacyl-CoA dehydrogenase NAD-binding domain-containing protein [Niveibacterium sp.]|uniref:3-hydroxyacyl-CoA dehydrogenase NAD-binding domain-containing protein n=1 Tax=Niveibacterium sp. TaxID=2017444 RepID=UPI0035B3791A
MTNLQSFQIERGEDGIVVVTIDMPGQGANTMNARFQEDFIELVARLEAARETTTGIILTSGKKTFFAGGDLEELIGYRREDAPRVFAAVEVLKHTMRRLERIGRPVVAAINGAALGGGWELALCAHQRICADDARIELGLPEVTLGLLPGAGGVVRMVRSLGLQRAAPYLLEGQRFRPADALAAGLVQRLVPVGEDLVAAARALIAESPIAQQPWDKEGFRIPGGGPENPKTAQMISVAPAALRAKTRGCYPAPEAVLATAVDSTRVDIDTALRLETRAFVELATGQVAKNMIGTLWFGLNEIKRGARRPQGVPAWQARKLGVLGAGMMGAGIAWAAASRGIDTVLRDVTLERAEKGKDYSRKLLDKRVARGSTTPEKRDATLARITPAADVAALDGCDLIIEAVFEQRALKNTVTREAEPMLAPDGVFASNTSTLPITGLAEASADPARFIGLHFFSPVDKMQLVEIIKGARTSAETLAKAYDFVQQIGKTPIVVNDSRGFFTSRVFGTFTNEGAALLADGVPAAVIENLAQQAGMPVGPLAVMDEVTLSLILAVADQAARDCAEAGLPYAPPSALGVVRLMAEAGRSGRSAGAGFYDYPADRTKALWPGLSEAFPVRAEAMPLDDVRDRILFIQAIESVRCLEEGVLESIAEANVGSIFGIGFPAWTGGVIQFINATGVAAFCARAEQLAARFGERFAPPALLRDKAARDEAFR